MEKQLKEVVNELYPVTPMAEQPANEAQMFMKIVDTINLQKQEAFIAGVNWHIEQLKRRERIIEIYQKANLKE